MKKNPIDTLVENLVKQFSQIPDFSLTQDDPLGNKMFNFVVRYISEISAFKNLFVQYYLPASLRASHDFQKNLKSSKYKHLINITNEELKENYYETIRLGYVGAYHKYESYLKDLLNILDEFFKDLDFENNFIDINSYLKNIIEKDLLKTVNSFKISEKINWISNCVKHYNGFPIKQPIPINLQYFDHSRKIEIESSEFKEDLDKLVAQCQLILSILFMTGFHQVLSQEFILIKSQLKEENQHQEKVKKIKDDLFFVINGFFGNNDKSLKGEISDNGLYL
ncbi:hypothetical protein GSF70_10420 [Flavobacteriaceae bacterium W22]|nr:hypothetical protein [Flavobacteriaceae bacterium W22]